MRSGRTGVAVSGVGRRVPHRLRHARREYTKDADELEALKDLTDDELTRKNYYLCGRFSVIKQWECALLLPRMCVY